VNDEAKVRRTTKSIVLGKAKVMQCEDIVEARAKRADKERDRVSKGKRGRKRKNPALEVDTKADTLEPKAPVARVI